MALLVFLAKDRGLELEVGRVVTWLPQFPKLHFVNGSEGPMFRAGGSKPENH